MTHTIREPWIPSLRLVLAIDLTAAAVGIGWMLIVVLRGPEDTSSTDTFGEVVRALFPLMLAATGLIVGGALALCSLVRRPLQTATGKWGLRFAVANALAMPVLVVSGTIIAAVLGFELGEGWGEPIAPFWLILGLTAAVLGIAAREPGRRGLLLIPFMAGAAVLVFWAGEVLSPH